jgi:hypothetical protein
MTTATRLILVSILGLSSCSSGDTSDASQRNKSVDTSHKVQANASSTVIDTIKRFTVDDYPVTNRMLEDTTSNNSSYVKQSGVIRSLDKVWFKDSALNQTLVFEMYTDKHRLAVFHFYNNDIPNGIIDRMELHNADGELATLEQKKKNIKVIVKAAAEIDSEYFTSHKSFRLSDDKEKVLRIYGTPDNRSDDGNLEILEWAFVGDILYDGKTDLKGKPLAKDNYGHQATMFFKKNRLIAIILRNDIP